jgi:hypothetical protein
MLWIANALGWLCKTWPPDEKASGSGRLRRCWRTTSAPLFPNFNHHGGPHHTFTVGNQTFCVAEPHHSPFVKKIYVNLFLEAMEAVELYEREG